MIKDYSSKMEFEKCILLRDKLYDLIIIDKLLTGNDSENIKAKTYTIKKTE